MPCGVRKGECKRGECRRRCLPVANSPRNNAFMTLIGRLTALARDTTIALVERGALPGSRQFDTGECLFDSIW
jgi:hypothetical protein